jgi:hypothetical protein
MVTLSRTSPQAGRPLPPAIDLELLALDLTSCTRCAATLANIGRAIEAVKGALEVAGTRVQTRTVIIESEDQARRYDFVTSPTIRINGRDIAFERMESRCDACSDLCGCGDDMMCRVWRYKGQEFAEAPVGLIVEAILREIGGRDPAPTGAAPGRDVPQNLRDFFARKAARQAAGSEPCCPTGGREGCCEPIAFAASCRAPETGRTVTVRVRA